MEQLQRWIVRGVAIDPLLVFAGHRRSRRGGPPGSDHHRLAERRRRAHGRPRSAKPTRARFEMEVAALKGRLQSMAEVAGNSQCRARARHSRAARPRQPDSGRQSRGDDPQDLRKPVQAERASRRHRHRAAEHHRTVDPRRLAAGHSGQQAAARRLRPTPHGDDHPGRPAAGTPTRFQATLSNGKRPDCLIHLPGSSAGIVIDAKFPLEAFEALRTAHDDALRKEAVAPRARRYRQAHRRYRRRNTRSPARRRTPC